MQIKKGLFVYTEKYERTVIRRKSTQAIEKAKCERCGIEVEWLTLKEVSAITGRNIEEIALAHSEHDFDLLLTKNGRLLFCRNSVFRSERVTTENREEKS